MPHRQQQWETQITVTDRSGPMILGLADEWSGGGKSSESKVYPRSRGDIQLGGKSTREDGKAVYLYADIAQFASRLDVAVGSGKATISRREVGDDGQQITGGDTVTLKGVLKSFALPDSSADGNDGATCELEFALDTDLVGA